MPIYEYRCASCGFEKDFLQKVSDPVLTDCPECGKAALEKQLTAAGFQLKGNGWYATDFKNNGAKPTADKNKKSGGGSEKSTEDSGKSTEDSGKSASGSEKPATEKDKPAEPKKEEKSAST